jgi:hypothetical protein
VRGCKTVPRQDRVNRFIDILHFAIFAVGLLVAVQPYNKRQFWLHPDEIGGERLPSPSYSPERFGSGGWRYDLT